MYLDSPLAHPKGKNIWVFMLEKGPFNIACIFYFSADKNNNNQEIKSSKLWNLRERTLETKN